MIHGASKLMAVAALATLLFGIDARAADLSEIGRILPEICKAGAGMNMSMGSPASMGMDMGPTDAAHQDLMKGMAEMDANMDQGMLADDIDVAFVCGMIPHHQGAIDMAKAELQHGKDPFARKLAQEIMTLQEQQIGAMLDWLKARSK